MNKLKVRGLCNEYNDDEFSQVNLNLVDEFEDIDNISQDVSSKPKKYGNGS